MEINEVIGIDPGVIHPAAACLDPDTMRLVRHVTMDGAPGKHPVSLSIGVFEIYHKMFTELAKRPGVKLIGMEGPAYRATGASHEQLARCRQAAHDMAAFFFEDYIWMEIPPTAAKKAATGNGNATKKTVAKMVLQMCGGEASIYEKNGYAVGDAASVAIATLNQYRAALAEEEARRRKWQKPRSTVV